MMDLKRALRRLWWKYVFKRDVRQIVLETSSVCNRACSYCPQSVQKRPAVALDAAVLDKLLRALREIRYNRTICLNLFNEPLAYPEQLLTIMRTIKSALPDCRILFSTNGDFLTAPRLRDLALAGLDELYITFHPDDPAAWSAETARERILAAAGAWGLSDLALEVEAEGHVQARARLDAVQVALFSRDYRNNGLDRAGAVSDAVAARDFVRSAPCPRPAHDFTISYNGAVYPCCQFYEGLAAHVSKRLGDISAEDPFLIYGSPKAQAFRRMASTSRPKPPPCRTCAE